MNLDLHFFRVDLTLAGFGLLALLLIAAEIGFRLGRRFAARYVSGGARGQFTTVQGAEFALVGLLLAFTFSMAASRYDSRKLAVVAESNAIGTAYLRADVLGPEDAPQLRSLLRQHVAAWFALSDSNREPAKWDAAQRTIRDLQGQMWAIASAACRRNPDSVAASLVLASLNDVFDRHSDSLFSFSNRLPGAAIVLLVGAATIAVGHLGFGSGVSGRRSLFTLGVFCCLIVVTILAILDFDRSRRGVFQVVPDSMIELRRSMAGSDS